MVRTHPGDARGPLQRPRARAQVRRARLPVALPQVLAVSAALQDRADLAYWLPPASAAAPPGAAAAAGAAARPAEVGDRSVPDAAVGGAGTAAGGGAEGDAGGLAADSQHANGSVEREAGGRQQAEAGSDAAHEVGGGAPAGGPAERAGEGPLPWLPLALEVGIGACYRCNSCALCPAHYSMAGLWWARAAAAVAPTEATCMRRIQRAYGVRAWLHKESKR